MNPNKLIIFDLDGTLYRLKGGSFANSELKKNMLKNATKYIQVSLGKTKNEALQILENVQKEYGENISIALEEKYNLNRHEYFEYVWDIEPKNLIIKYDGLEHELMRLSKEYQFLLTSDAPRKWINNVLKELGISSFFEGRILSGEGNRRKIFGNRFSYIAQKYNIKPNRIVSMGDQEESDIIPAKKLGFKTIYINNKHHSEIADINIKDITHLEIAFDFLFNNLMENKYYSYAIKQLGIKDPYKTITLSGSSSSVVFKYSNWIYKCGPLKECEKELALYDRFKDTLNFKFESIFPRYNIVSSSKDILLYRLEFIGEYNLEDYLLSPELHEDMVSKKIYRGVLNNIRTIYKASSSNDKDLIDDFFIELMEAIKQNIEKAGLLDKKTTIFLRKVKQNKKIFIHKAICSLAHKDLTAGNILIDKDGSHLVRFIDPRPSLPFLNKPFQVGNISIDIIGYYITVLRKEREHEKLFGHKKLTTAKKAITEELDKYIKEEVTNEHLLDLATFFWYSVYVACKCNYCMSKKRKWLYDEMKFGYDKYMKKITMSIQKNAH